MLKKNENGEFVLLCPSCSKKYFNGALEIKFDMKKPENELIQNNNLLQAKASLPRPELGDIKSNNLSLIIEFNVSLPIGNNTNTAATVNFVTTTVNKTQFLTNKRVTISYNPSASRGRE